MEASGHEKESKSTIISTCLVLHPCMLKATPPPPQPHTHTSGKGKWAWKGSKNYNHYNMSSIMPMHVQSPHPPPPILTPVGKDNSHIPHWAVCNRSVHQHTGLCHLDTPQPLPMTWKYTPYQGCSDTGTFHPTPTCVGGPACVCMHVWVLPCACVCTCMHMSAYSCMHVCECVCMHAHKYVHMWVSCCCCKH